MLIKYYIYLLTHKYHIMSTKTEKMPYVAPESFSVTLVYEPFLCASGIPSTIPGSTDDYGNPIYQNW